MNFKLHTSFDTLTALAPAWNDLVAAGVTNVPFLRYEYLSTWWGSRGGGEWPNGELAVVTASEDERLVGIAPLFSTTNRTGESALMLLGSIEISDYLDLIVPPESLQPFVSGLLDCLVQAPPQPWSVLDWYNLPDVSPTLVALEAESVKRSWTFIREVYQPTPYIPLPGDFEMYLDGLDKKQRHEIRRKMRRAEESGRGVHWYIVQDESTLDAELEAFMTLMAHDPQKDAFLTPAMRAQMKASAHAAFRAGHLQLAFLEVDGEKACVYFNFDYANRIWVYNSGLNRKFMDISPGWVLLGHLLEWANNNKRSEFDFMRGNEEYKYRFGALDRQVIRVRVSRA
jgi:CelD/BcsL family acetyltransferase involved in cellulose biosynthesis